MSDVEYQTERLDHLGRVAGVYKEAGIAQWVDKQAGEQRRVVSVGTATVAMSLNGLGFSNRQLYLVPQYFVTKPGEHWLGEGITADRLNDDGLGRTLDWISEHDPTTLFAGLALQARQRFGIKAQHLHVDTTSFSVRGESQPGEETGNEEGAAVPIAITYGYSRDHRAELNQWMVGRATPQDGDVPVVLRPLDGKSSAKASIRAMVRAVMTQLRETLPEEQEERIAIFESGGYSEAPVKSSTEAKIKWISRVPETSTAAKTAVQEEAEEGQRLSEGSGHYGGRIMDLPQGKERWVIVRTEAGLQTAKEQMQKKGKKTPQTWEKRLWHLSKQALACENDAQQAGNQAMKGNPSFLVATFTFQEQGHSPQKGRPKKEATPDQSVWQLVPTLAVDQQEVEGLIRKQASFIIATNILDEQSLSHEPVFLTSKEQGGGERGFRFLKDPLFLASSGLVKQPERGMALSFILGLCLLVYRLVQIEGESCRIRKRGSAPLTGGKKS